MKLFVSGRLEGFEKIAKKELRNPANWGQEVLSYLMEKSPFVGLFPTTVAWVSKDPENGHAFGYVEVSSSGKKARIPFFIKGNDLIDMDLMVSEGQMLPLTEPRLNEALFSPEAFSGLQKKEDVVPPFLTLTNAMQSQMGNAYPPDRHYGLGTNVKLSFLKELKPMMRKEALEDIARVLDKDDVLRKLAINNDGVLEALSIFADSEKMEKKALLTDVAVPEPQVIQIVALPKNQYSVKTANANAYRVDREILDRVGAIAKYGQNSVRVADNNGSVTASFHAKGPDDAGAETRMELISRAGIYKVMTIGGDLLTGMVVDPVVDLAGNNLGAQLFICGDRYALQPHLRGDRIGDINMANWTVKPTKGFGCFVWDQDEDRSSSRDGKEWHHWMATTPMTVERIEQGEVQEITVTDMMGAPRKIVPSPVKTLISTKETALIPQRAVWMPLGSVVSLVDTAGSAEKIAEAKDLDKSVLVKYVGDRFSLSGMPLRKLAEVERTGLDWKDAVFLSCAMGMHPEFAMSKLAQAVKYGKTTTKVANVAIPYAEYCRMGREKAAAHYDMQERQAREARAILLKEAVAMEAEEETLDSLLSLNFLTPETLEKFIEYLPQLESTQRKLCELLMAARAGEDELNEGALRSSVKALEKTIEGLKRLAQTHAGAASE